VPETNQSFQSFICGTVSEAPESVGLYAWYGRVDAGEADWRFDPVEGADAGTGRFLGLLARHSSRHQPQPIFMTGVGPFASVLTGELQDRTQDSLQKALAWRGEAEPEPSGQNNSGGPGYDEERTAKVHMAAESAEHRKALAAILGAATPLLTAPLYIGVAKNLRVRLGTHASQVFKAAKFVRDNPDGREQLLQGDKPSFAARAVAAGFSPDNLVVWTLNLDKLLAELSDVEKKRAIAEAAEWFLNRWHRPIFGRR